ncbi:hypothetical protein DZF91_36290 [Actinomadura logoneensis]|uniref:Chemotaxis protein n=1 Tax=Actinomadura logoneensis TaxID=2293572 RepID=A0A372J9T8_9ACTN|nr:hypothetical protein [Actinomadura logoneensis]RFU36785.1 hypothetical protein DZF91_36290 [Actinomadura logoneensis]
MDAATLSELRRPRSYPAVSVLMPTFRRAPDNRQDPIRLRNLLAEVRRRLRDDPEVPTQEADALYRDLETAAARLDPADAEEGLVLFAAPGGEVHTFTIDQPVEERVVLDNTFATRDLVAAYTRRTRYWLLVLSDHRTRLWDGRGETLTQVEREGFPMTPESLDEAVVGKASPPSIRDANAPHQLFVRRTVEALEKINARDRRPVIIAGVVRAQAWFDEEAGGKLTVAGRIDGAYEDAPASVLMDLARPVLHAYEDLREVGVLTELEAARGLKRYAAGLQEVLPLVKEGRGEHLVVERGYHMPGLRGPDGVIDPLDDTSPGRVEGEGIIDDVVDNLIEAQLDFGGEVTFVSDGFLVDHDRIALVTRF